MPAAETGFILKKKDDLAYLQAFLFEKSGLVDHAFSTRLGGVSSGHLASLNTAFHTGDREENVLENRRRFFELFGCDHLALTSSIQVHGSKLFEFDDRNRGEGALPKSASRRCDALITAEPGLPLAAYSADCQLVYISSNKGRPLVALAHAGWRGTLAGIGVKVIRYLQDRYMLDPGCLLAALSPAICRNCYTVGSDAAAKFQSAGWGGSPYLEPAGSGKYSLDLSAINTAILLRAGVKAENLAVNRWCTACQPDLFYSYRRDKGTTGRMIGFIAIRDPLGGKQT